MIVNLRSWDAQIDCWEIAEAQGNGYDVDIPEEDVARYKRAVDEMHSANERIAAVLRCTGINPVAHGWHYGP